MADLENKFCRKPFEHFEVDSGGRVSLCCYTWLPHHAGVVSDTSSVHQVFNSEKVQDIRRSIHDESFSYCSHTLCPHIQNGSLPTKDEVEGPRMQKIVKEKSLDNLKPDFYNLCYDMSCNLSCPSCRTGKIVFTKGEQYEKRLKIQNRIAEELFNTPHDRNCTVNITGSGDPFGSKLFRDLLFNIDGKIFPNVSINLQTNGVMFTEKYWNRMHKIHPNINSVIISFDAGTEQTYNITRRGGNWKQLLKNMEFLSTINSHDTKYSNPNNRNKLKEVRIDFVVQQANYKEMPLIIELGKKLKVDKVYFSIVVNWGTWPKEEFAKQAVYNEDHPEYNDFIDILSNTIFNDPIVDMGNVTRFKELVCT